MNKKCQSCPKNCMKNSPPQIHHFKSCFFLVAKNSTAGDNLQTTDAEIVIKIESKHCKEQIQKVQM